MDGQLVQNETLNSNTKVISTNQLNNGVYYIQILNKDELIDVKKIVIFK